MMGNIFYIIGIFIFVLSFSNIFNFFKYLKIKNWAVGFKKVTGKEPDKKEFRSLEEYNIFTGFSIISIVEFFWLILGLATASWYVYLSIIILGVIIRHTCRITKITFLEYALGFPYNLAKVFMILFLIINHFHLHLDILELFRQLI
jgi:hypothetical protein